MAVRVATIDDLELLVTMAKKFLATTVHSEHVNEEDIRSFAIQFLSNPDATKRIALIFEDIGVIGGTVQPFPWGKIKRAHEIMWWVEPDARGKQAGIELFNAFEYWAKQIGCKQIIMVGLEDRACQFYEKNGYVLQERGYLKEI